MGIVKQIGAGFCLIDKGLLRKGKSYGGGEDLAVFWFFSLFCVCIGFIQWG